MALISEAKKMSPTIDLHDYLPEGNFHTLGSNGNQIPVILLS